MCMLQVVKMLATIVLFFGLCWLPLHLFNIVYIVDQHAFGGLATAKKIFIGAHWLSMANSFVNPLIYGCMNDNFRVKSLKYICMNKHNNLQILSQCLTLMMGLVFMLLYRNIQFSSSNS